MEENQNQNQGQNEENPTRINPQQVEVSRPVLQTNGLAPFVIPVTPEPPVPQQPVYVPVPPRPTMPEPLPENPTHAQRETFNLNMKIYTNMLSVYTMAVGQNITIDMLFRLVNHRNPRSENSNAPKSSLPDKFNGDQREQAAPFLGEMESLFQLYPEIYNSHGKMVAAVGSRLSGKASIWHNSIRYKYQGENADYLTYRQEFMVTQGVVNAQQNAELELRKESMKQGRSPIALTITRFRTLAINCHWNTSEQTKIDKLFNLMNDELKDNVDTFPIDNPDGSSPCTDFDYFCTKVIERDNNLFKKRMRKRNNSTFDRPSNGGPKKRSNVSEIASKPKKKKKLSTMQAIIMEIKSKLTPEEYKRRMDNKLCLYCGKGGHRIKDCRARANKNSSMNVDEMKIDEVSIEE